MIILKTFHSLSTTIVIGMQICLMVSCSTKQKEFFIIESEGTKLKVEMVTDSITIPFGMN